MNIINKGKTFERHMAKLLTKYTGVGWLRVPMSGAFSTVNKTQDHRFNGDIFTEDSNYQDVIIECKSIKNRITLEDLTNPKSLVWKWVEQTRRESNGYRWILFFKANFGEIFAITYTPVSTLPFKNMLDLVGIIRNHALMIVRGE